jgi:hypothetical protein
VIKAPFNLAAYLAAVAVGMMTTTGILLSAARLNPGALGLLFAVLLTIPAAFLFLPATLICLRLTRRLKWRSLSHHLLFGAAVSLSTTLVALLVALIARGQALGSNWQEGSYVALPWLLGIAAGGAAAGAVYWVGNSRQ